jgi:hypothetical protein
MQELLEQEMMCDVTLSTEVRFICEIIFVFLGISGNEKDDAESFD